MIRIVLYVLLIWFIYQFVFKLVIPVYKTTRKIKKGFREMQEQMNAAQQEQFRQQQTAETSKQTTTKSGDYIEFEEIKDRES